MVSTSVSVSSPHTAQYGDDNLCTYDATTGLGIPDANGKTGVNTARGIQELGGFSQKIDNAVETGWHALERDLDKVAFQEWIERAAMTNAKVSAIFKKRHHIMTPTMYVHHYRDLPSPDTICGTRYVASSGLISSRLLHGTAFTS